MKLAAALCIVSLGLAVTATAQTPPPKSDTPTIQTATAAAKPNDGDKITCRDDETTGQRIKSRICHTKSQWAAMEEGAKQHIHDLQEHPGTGCTSCR